MMASILGFWGGAWSPHSISREVSHEVFTDSPSFAGISASVLLLHLSTDDLQYIRSQPWDSQLFVHNLTVQKVWHLHLCEIHAIVDIGMYNRNR